ATIPLFDGGCDLHGLDDLLHQSVSTWWTVFCSGSALIARSCLRCLLGRLGRVRLGYVDTTFEICPVFNDDAGGLDVADNGGAGAERDPLLGLDVSTYR